MSSPRSYTVVGGGAIGGTIAFHLARVGHPVLVVDVDPAHVAAVCGSGLTIRRTDGREESQRVEARTPDEVGGSLHAVVLAVKAQATSEAANWIAPRLAADGFVVSLQNGLCEPEIATAMGISQGTVKSTTSRAIAALARQLKERS